MRQQYNELAGACGGVYADTPFGRMMLQSENLLSAAHDPQWPDAGCEFMRKLRASGCRERGRNLGKNLPAVFRSFNPNWRRPYIPRVVYHTGNERNIAGITLSRAHEGDHAMAYDAAIIHTSPFNSKASYCVMCPETFLKLVDLTERNAYVKQAWLASLLSEKHPEFLTFTQNDPITAQEFLDKRAEMGGDLEETMVVLARTALSKWKRNAGTYANHYHLGALAAYGARLKYLREQGVQPFFVKMDMQDLADVGNTFGPNIFAGREEFLKLPALMPEAAGRLQAIQDAWNLNARSPMPFGHLLTMRGESRSGFLHMSKTWGARTPVMGFMNVPSLAA